ncbi:DUF4145 domain-containing protein [Blastomonas aquatica]|uniref:DUF4145 domain-containing protein n=1 Tax=Blastomonas aquatica TaxID=1510276 RepID=A0ABQ1IRA0_9SPHN|nr:DUF4145 domain-containing protein [Blastomonas aquatica]GGB49866.1 hypothetical protein GCM10010833_00640 [Blastomonas aquatica]
MGVVAKRNCPYCRTQDVAFTAKSSWKSENDGNRALFICGACSEGVIWEWSGGADPCGYNGHISSHRITLLRQWPDEASGAAPADTPPTTSRYFEQATASLINGHFDAAAMMFRKCLESATKLLSPESTSKSLYSRIEALVAKGALTEDMGKWAHEVRLGGNDAAHDDEPFTISEAEELRNFIENFLRYAFTLPSAVHRRAKPGLVEE